MHQNATAQKRCSSGKGLNLFPQHLILRLDCPQCRRVVLQEVDQHERHSDVRRQRHVDVDGHLPVVVRR